MNFYKHHLGDYDGHTAHLSWDEDMAYTRLMRAYYRRELPIPEVEAYRLCRAISKAQKEAVDSVLREFFKLIEGGWRNKRCDEEITAYQAQASTNRRIARERTVPRTVDESLNEASTKRTPNQIPEPLTNNQQSKTLSGKPDAVEVLKFLNLKANRNYQPVKANTEMIQARLAEGFTVAELKQVVAKKTREWLADDKMAEYLRPKTLFSRTNFANYAGELVNAAESS